MDDFKREARPEVPPSRGSVRPHYETAANWMRESPDQWIKITTSEGYGTTSNMNRGAYRAFPAGEFEFVSRKRKGDGMVEVWGRVKP